MARKKETARKSPSSRAGEYVREEIHHVREGKHGARSPEQAIAIGLSKARRAGEDVPPPERGEAKASTRRQARRDLAKGRKAKAGGRRRKSAARARATRKALKREGRSAASRQAMSRQAKRAAARRSPAERSRAAKKAARTRARRKKA